jgi:hypothetical protein
MKCKILFFVLVSALCCTGCGGKKPVPGADARQIVGEPGIQKFEVALNELIVQPFPDPSAQDPDRRIRRLPERDGASGVHHRKYRRPTVESCRHILQTADALIGAVP